jgi:hypothetical protein
MLASKYGYEEVVRTLLHGGANVNAKSNVRNQMMVIMMMMIMMMMMMI